jgi:hypothetical protein
MSIVEYKFYWMKWWNCIVMWTHWWLQRADTTVNNTPRRDFRSRSQVFNSTNENAMKYGFNCSVSVEIDIGFSRDTPVEIHAPPWSLDPLYPLLLWHPSSLYRQQTREVNPDTCTQTQVKDGQRCTQLKSWYSGDLLSLALWYCSFPLSYFVFYVLLDGRPGDRSWRETHLEYEVPRNRK